MKIQKAFVLFLLITCLTAPVTAQQFKRATVEKVTNKAIAKAYGASVRLWGFDTVKKAQNSAQFSGVVVSADGYILTVAHAVQPNHTYKVFFPDGKEAIAVALGRMGFKEQDNMPDMAMMKIVSPGVWPYAEMGWSSSMKVNSLCLSIAYPETLNQKQPTIRMGRVVNVLNQWGFLQASCPMEPGDSGGPLFDELGRVIALHSRCDVPEDANMEVPIDLYRKYWSALQIAKDYESLPDATTALTADPMLKSISSMPALVNLNSNFKVEASKLEGSSVRITSSLKGKEQQILGTFISTAGLPTGRVSEGESVIVSKSSMVGTSPVIATADGQNLPATILFRDKQSDLVVLKAGKLKGKALNISKLSSADTLVFGDRGKFMISPLTAGQSKTGVLGSGYFNQPRNFSVGFFGASANFIEEKIILTRFAPGSPAELATLKLGDQITGINRIAISRPQHYGGELMKYAAGDTVSIQGIRAGVAFDLPTILKPRPVLGNHPADRFSGGKSTVLDGFDRVFSHDMILKPEECGGPVFDANGKFYGINIARFSRTTSLAIPADVIMKVLQGK